MPVKAIQKICSIVLLSKIDSKLINKEHICSIYSTFVN